MKKCKICSKNEVVCKELYQKHYNQYRRHKKILDLQKIKNKPYFARIDFKGNGEKLEKLYIGKICQPYIVIETKYYENIFLISTFKFNTRILYSSFYSLF